MQQKREIQGEKELFFFVFVWSLEEMSKVIMAVMGIREYGVARGQGISDGGCT